MQDVNTAQAQTEKEKIHLQLHEIETFKTKMDELIAEGYDPKLDDGVGKNIAPLQKKGLLRAEVLKANQLTKSLNADWQPKKWSYLSQISTRFVTISRNFL